MNARSSSVGSATSSKVYCMLVNALRSAGNLFMNAELLEFVHSHRSTTMRGASLWSDATS